MPFTPSTAAQNAAALAGANQAALASPLIALRDSIVAGNLAPAALIDAILSAVGYQGRDVSFGAGTTTSASYVNAFGSWTFSAPIAKVYLLHIDAVVSSSVLVGGRSQANFQVLVNGSPVAIDGGQAIIDMISSTNYWSGSWRVPVTLNAGNNTIQLQALQNVAGANIGFAGSAHRTFTITG
jgi:hypothetical protein